MCLLFFIFLKHNQKGCDILIFGFDDLANTKVQQQIFKLFCFRLKKPETQNNNFDNMQKIAKKTTKQDVVNNRYYFIHCDVMT